MSVLPIVTYNDPVLKEKTKPVEKMDQQLENFIDDLFETMYNARGVGLAAPQVGELISVFVADADLMAEETGEPAYGPIVFINPEIKELKGEMIRLEEGCLSIPEVRDDVKRSESVVISYRDQNFDLKEQEFSGWLSRVIQHEYDHLQGILFLDHLSAFKRRIHKSRLQKIESGLLETEYPLVPKTVGKQS
jgi:peptide deformylase